MDNITNFDCWNSQKKNLWDKEIPYFYEREVWFISMWKNVWYEQDGKWELFYRPVVIIKKFNKDCFYWIPLTSVDKTWKKFYLELSSFEKSKKSFAILSQLKLFSSKRLAEKKWVINEEEFLDLKKKIKEFI